MKKSTSKKLFNIAVTTAMATGAITAAAPSTTEAAKNFTDVKSSHIFYQSIMELVDRGVVAGYPDGTFKPKQSIARAHAAKIIAGILGLDTVNVKDPQFKDVPKTSPYYGAIAALQNAGIVNGMTDATFGVNKNLSRGEMAVILTNAFGLKAQATATPFKDIANSHYKAEILALYSNKVTGGTSATAFSPKANVTRGQLTAFVIRAEKVKEVTPTPQPENPDSKPENPTLPENPTQPEKPGTTPDVPETPTPEQVKEEFVNKLTMTINKTNENAASQNYLVSSKPRLENGRYNIDVTIQESAKTATLTELLNHKEELLPFISENIDLVSSIQFGEGTQLSVTKENRGELLLAAVEAMGINVLSPNATLGDAAGKEINLNLWVKNGGTNPVPLKLNFK